MPMVLRIAEGEGTAEMKESGQCHTPATLPSRKKSPSDHWKGACVSHTDNLNTVEKTKIFSVLASDPQFLSYLFHSLVTISR